jgi:integrase/recombinase XerD
MMREGQAKVLNEKEFNRTLGIINTKAHAKRNSALLHLSFGLGLRAKELASLTIGHVIDHDYQLLDEINLTGNMTKGKRQRHIYVTNNRVKKVLEEYLEFRRLKDGILFSRDAALFRSQKGSFFTPNTIQQLLHNIFDQAGLSGASSHSGRRTFATKLIEKGVDIKAISVLMGHSSITMTARYIENNPIRLKRIAHDVF